MCSSVSNRSSPLSTKPRIALAPFSIPSQHSLRVAAPLSDSVKVKFSATPPPSVTAVMTGVAGVLAHTQSVATEPENWSPTQ